MYIHEVSSTLKERRLMPLLAEDLEFILRIWGERKTGRDITPGNFE
jgi:hypothetical protein